MGAVQAKQDAMLEMIKTLSTRLEQLEQIVSASNSGGDNSGGAYASCKPNQPPGDIIGEQQIICRKCGIAGHFARGCAANCGTSRPANQGN